MYYTGRYTIKINTINWIQGERNRSEATRSDVYSSSDTQTLVVAIVRQMAANQRRSANNWVLFINSVRLRFKPRTATRRCASSLPTRAEHRQRSRIQMINNNIKSQLQPTIDHDHGLSLLASFGSRANQMSVVYICAKRPPNRRWRRVGRKPYRV